jgi:hypothetical protein
VVVVAGIGALLIALGGLAAAGYALFTNLDTSDSTFHAASSAITNSDNNGIDPKGFNPGINPRIGNKGGFAGQGGINPKDHFNSGKTNPIPIEPPFQNKKETTFELRPVLGANQPISPPAIDLAAPVTRSLPGRADSVTVGGNGRYIIFFIMATQQITVFDASKGDFVATQRIPDMGQVFLAGGQNRVVTCSLGERMLRSYTLPDLKKEFDISSPLFHFPSAVAMGSATNSPVLVSDPFGDIALIELTNTGGKVLEGSKTENRSYAPPNFPEARINHLLAAPNGRTFLVSREPEQNERTGILTEQNQKWKAIAADVSAPSMSADGRYVLGFNHIVDMNGRTVVRPAGVAGAVWYVAGTSGRGFLRLEERKEQGKQVVSITVHTTPSLVEKDPKPVQVGVLPETDGLIDWFSGNPLPLYQHLFLIPDAKLLVVMPATKDKIVLRKVEAR